VIDMTDAEQLAHEEAQEISINGTKAEDYLVYDEELDPKLSDKLKQFLVSLKEAFKQAGINPDEIDWSPTNVMNHKGNYVLVDV
jgi:ABC-type phosphate/phosphonate transport system substrate-binding protein